MTARLPVLLVGLLALLPGSATAQPPGAEHPTAARELGRILTGDRLEVAFAHVMNAMMPLMRSVAERDLKRPLTQAEETALLSAFRRSFEQTYPRTLLEEETSQILSRSFTEPELGDLLTFYRSPVGTRLLGLNTVLMEAGERIFKSREQQFGDSLRGELARELRRSSP